LQDGPYLPAAVARHPIIVDGRLDEPDWATATPVRLLVPADRDAGRGEPADSCTARVLWNETHLYFAADCGDTDLVAEGEADQIPQFQVGDVFEVFLRPPGRSWYWEFHVTPTGHKTAYFFPGGGHLGLPSPLDYKSGLQVAAQVDGTLNAWTDRDHGWTAEMAVPMAELTAMGPAPKAPSAWCVLLGRYNYSRYLPRVEVTAWPRLNRTDFHDHAEHGLLRLSPE
jgi:hypothetical protein